MKLIEIEGWQLKFKNFKNLKILKIKLEVINLKL